ncbi:unnamed protein product [Rhizophagus irregularis]|nr:unnamed protein product [Rhizophagus irregularis]
MVRSIDLRGEIKTKNNAILSSFAPLDSNIANDDEGRQSRGDPLFTFCYRNLLKEINSASNNPKNFRDFSTTPDHIL